MGGRQRCDSPSGLKPADARSRRRALEGRGDWQLGEDAERTGKIFGLLRERPGSVGPGLSTRIAVSGARVVVSADRRLRRRRPITDRCGEGCTKDLSVRDLTASELVSDDSPKKAACPSVACGRGVSRTAGLIEVALGCRSCRRPGPLPATRSAFPLGS